jgi:hypothetical protein
MFPADFQTTEDGDVFAFFFVDAYNQFLFNTGMERDCKPDTVLKHINLLTQHKEFLRHKGKPFTLVLHKFWELEEPINAIITPLNGKVVFNDTVVAQVVMPVLKVLYKNMAGRK